MSNPLILIDEIDGQQAVALWRDGALDDFLLDPPESDATPVPGSIYRARVGRPMKGMHGAMVDLANGQTGFLRETKGTAPGEMILVQVSTFAEPGKAPPVTRRILFKSRFAIVTPNKPGINIARSIRDEDTRLWLSETAHDEMDGADPTLGLIIRTAAALSDRDAVAEDIAAMRSLAEAVLNDDEHVPTLLVEAPNAEGTAWRDWPIEAEIEAKNDAFERADIWGALDGLRQRRFDLGGGAWMQVDPTAALVAVDVNTGGDATPAAGIKANRAAARALPRALRLLGLGGVIAVDFAPMSKGDRREIETMLKAAFRADSVETSLAGWTTLGLFELQRKRERRPLSLPEF